METSIAAELQHSLPIFAGLSLMECNSRVNIWPVRQTKATTVLLGERASCVQ